MANSNQFRQAGPIARHAADSNGRVKYGAFTVSQSQVERVREYIRNQEVHHSRISFEEEFKALLESHGIEFEEKYLWI